LNQWNIIILRIIVIKELFDNILNLRFSIALILCVIITFSCVVILTHQYQQELEDYQTRTALQDDFLNNYAHINRMGGMITPQKPPERFRQLVIGIPLDADVGSFDDNPLPVLFPPIDFVFIVTIIMSLLAILFSYDSITGERECGTLRLMTSNSISRVKVLLGKWIGGMGSLSVPFLLSLFTEALYIAFHPGVQWDGSAWLTFFLLLVSVTFISLFYLLGLLVSSFSRYSSTSILASLFLWVLFVLVIPHMSPYVSAQIYSIPSINKVEREIFQLTSTERDEMGRSLSREVRRRFENEYGQFFKEYSSMS